MNQQVSFVQLESLLMNLVVADKNFVSVSCALARTPSSSPKSDRILGRAQLWNMIALILRNAVRDEHMWKIRFYMSDWSLDDSFSLKKPWGNHSLISINMQRCLEKLKMRIGNGPLIDQCLQHDYRLKILKGGHGLNSLCFDFGAFFIMVASSKQIHNQKLLRWAKQSAAIVNLGLLTFCKNLVHFEKNT